MEGIFINLVLDVHNEVTMKWNNRTPVSFQQFTNNNYLQEKTTKYTCVIVTTKFQGVILEIDPKLACAHTAKIKMEVKETIYPHTVKTKMCSLLLLTNLGEPEWIQVDCKKHLLQNVICTGPPRKKFNTSKSDANIHNLLSNAVCKSNLIMKKTNCYLFVWYKHNLNSNTILGDFWQLEKEVSNFTDLMFDFIFLLDAISSVFPPIILSHETNTSLVYQFIYERHLKQFEKNTELKSMADGFKIYQSKKTSIVLGTNMFKCEKGGYVSCLNLCDNTVDCPNDQSDEQYCICNTSHANKLKKRLCKEVALSRHRRMCFSLYYTDHKGFCNKYVDVSLGQYKSVVSENKWFYKCDNGLELDILLLDDLVADCGLHAEDESELKSLLSNGNFSSCELPYQIPCKMGHLKCYNVTSICSYSLNKYQHVVPCRNGGHLENCKEFECSTKFKCPSSYCIPWIYICDGKWDCSYGEDERYRHVCGQDLTCDNMFKCKNKGCIHLDNVCDARQDCPLGDDEELCSLKDTLCPLRCQCLTFAIECKNLNPNMKSRFPHISVSVYHSKIPNLQDFLYQFKKSVYLRVTSNHLSDICHQTFPKELIFLDVGFNLIKIIERNCFKTLIQIKTLLLEFNKITVLKRHSFVNLTKINFLSLSNNPLIDLPKEFMIPLPLFRIISLNNLSLTDLGIEGLSNIEVDIINTTHYHICCIAPSNAKCITDKPWYISCNDLLPNNQMKIIFTVLPILIFILNGLSILIRFLTRDSKKSFSMSVTAINICDIILGIFLCILWIYDGESKGTFLVNEAIWRSSLLCFCAFESVLLFSFLSPLLIFFLSLSRLMVVIHPIDTKFKTTEFTFKAILYVYLSCTLSSLAITFVVNFTEKQLPSILCFPFVDPSNSVIILTVITWMTVLSQTATSVSICITHSLLVYNLQKSHESVRKSKLDDNSNASLIMQLLIVTSSNILCWFPANSVYISAMFLSRYPVDLVLWTTIAALPVNSLVNPAVFVIVFLRKCYKCEGHSTEVPPKNEYRKEPLSL